MKKQSLALLILFSFPAAAMNETSEKAIQYTAGLTGAAVGAYFAACFMNGRDETHELIGSVKNTITSTKACKEVVSNSINLDAVKKTGKNCAIAGFAVLGAMASMDGTKIALQHLFHPKTQ